MTEIPEHLLRRSRERRAAIGKGGDDGGESAGDAAPATQPATTSPAAAEPAAPTGPPVRQPAPEPSAPPPPKPDPPYVAAAKRRRRIPFWAMATLSLMPIWGFMYVRALTQGPEVVEGPLGEGAEVYSNCASCHGADGGGGVGYQFSGGEVLLTFPNIEDQLRYVYWGTEGYNLAGVDIYGNPDREGGPHVVGGLGNMPAFGEQLTDHEIVSVICHERYTLGGADPTSEEWADEYETWCAEGAPAWEAVDGGELALADPEVPADLAELGVEPIGEPVEGSPDERLDRARQPGGAVTTTEVLVVGAGPAGASTATRLARAGHDVTVVERSVPPRHKTCGDALSPLALRELADLDVDPLALGAHRVDGIRFVHGGRGLPLPWPPNAESPDHGAVLRRSVLDEHLMELAATTGARVLRGHEAVGPVVERGFVRGADVVVAGEATTEIRARFLLVADGANSRFGRSLGTTRERAWPYGVATRTYFRSPRATEDWMEVALGPADPNGNAITGFGWINPVGDGTVNVGIGMLSTYRDVMGVNAIRLLRSFAAAVADQWGLDPDAPLDPPARFRIPLGGSVGPRMGPTFLVAGDAGGLAHPLTGDGVGAALASGRIAADVLDEALASGSSTSLQRYPTALGEEVDHPHVVGRLAARFLGRPAILGPALWLGMRSEKVLGGAFRIATDELRTDGRGGAERADRVARFLARFAPRW